LNNHRPDKKSNEENIVTTPTPIKEIINETEKIHQPSQKEKQSKPDTEEVKICQPTTDIASPPPILDELQEESKLKPLTDGTKTGKKEEMIGDYTVGKLLGVGGYG